ncbi:hypothetical protein N0V93_001657 [Gnomoniopsis smithogilvyi]|uniref:Glycosyl transferase CAP10 domain-containing protein n=1 Tax=Gnomoniopsis smithogilvyi TaxID=1191159 RepID=A0A9W9D2E6_9PEZI|nr:hypothetical protein N0V93_001657 [Gnomoniopsis smithogilvyi]
MDGPLGHISLLIAALAVVWTYRGIDQISVLEHPLHSQFLVPLLCSGLAFTTNAIIRRLVKGPGRFDDDGRARRLEESRAISLPKRPLRGSWALLPLLIACRLSLLTWLHSRLQCSYAGVEPLLPIILAGYDTWQKIYHASTAIKDDDEDDDMGADLFEDFAKWFLQSDLPRLLGAVGLTCGFLMVTSTTTKSTFICPASTSPHLVLFWQLMGLGLDALILVLSWRILQWARSTTDRLQNVGMIMLSSAGFSGLFTFLQYRISSEFQLAAAQSFSSLDFIHICGQSTVLLFIAATLFTTQSSPVAATAVVVFMCGAYSAGKKLALVGTYEQLSKSQVFLGTGALGLGFIVLAYRTQIRHIGLPRGLISFIMTAWVIGAIVYCALTSLTVSHSINMIMYSTRTEVHRWLIQDAKASDSLKVAVREYSERHNGRLPPPSFDIWYEYATSRNSPIIDSFKQIDEDLRPFWAMDSKSIRQAVSKMDGNPGIASITIEQGVVSSKLAPDNPVIVDLIQLIQPFAQYLPDMTLPVNLLEQPRVLPPWSQVIAEFQEEPTDQQHMWPWDHQHLLGQACPPKTPASAGFYSPTATFCGACTQPYSVGQFPTTASLSRDLCYQPDMLNLHGFYMSNHPIRPFTELLPVFSGSKTNQHKDILIPLSWAANDYSVPSDDKVFTDKQNQLFWRGNVAADHVVPPTLLRGGHQERLSHLVNNASASEVVTVLLAKDGDEGKFQYHTTGLQNMNDALEFDLGISDYSKCAVPACDLFKEEFGVKSEDVDGQTETDSRYVMVMDGDLGPSRHFLRSLRSNSVPFVASIFKEWYSERLFPWIHYVPIDLRFHGLHSTLAYFMGLDGKGPANERYAPMPPQLEDAKSIAQEGKQWAAQAIRREDAEIYMFRLLLEWGRVINDKRDGLGFSMDKEHSTA